MPTIIVETGSGDNPAANSFVSESELIKHAADRGIELSSDAGVLLIKAMDYLQSISSYKGTITSQTQPLLWPREDVVIDGREIEKNQIPAELKNFQLDTALDVNAGNSQTETRDSRSVIRERVGSLEVEYARSSSSQTFFSQRNATWLNKLTNGSVGQGFGSVVLGRG